ncbi:cytochrome c oxidase assembly protein [Marinomonas agarivorans]|nr:cytochrome c oxidase assembly protein [Marinomonas agarivorans]
MDMHKKLILQLSTACLGMFLFGFALVPLYDVFCEITGLNGKVDLVESKKKYHAGVDETRLIKVQFIANRNENMPWKFSAQNKEVVLHPGANGQAIFYVKNTTQREMIGQAIVSVSPSASAKYFHKTQCFCFERQALKAGQEESIGVVFSIDPDIPEEITKMTLSYTFFDITDAIAER